MESPKLLIEPQGIEIAECGQNGTLPFHLLIEPQGIEISLEVKSILWLVLLIEPQGIEIVYELRREPAVQLLIEPQGIEISMLASVAVSDGSFNRTTRN